MKKLLTIMIACLAMGSTFAQSTVEATKNKVPTKEMVRHREPIHRSKENIERLKKQAVEHDKLLKSKNINSDTPVLPTEPTK